MENNNYGYICPNGKVYGIPKGKHCCLICRYCSDIFWDYTNGPYLTFCGSHNKDINQEDFGKNCSVFQLDFNTKTIEQLQREGKSLNGSQNY